MMHRDAWEKAWDESLACMGWNALDSLMCCMGWDAWDECF